LNGFSARLSACASLAIRCRSVDPVNCANENRRCVLSSPSCSTNCPDDINTSGSSFQSCVSVKADNTKSFGRQVRPVLSVYADQRFFCKGVHRFASAALLDREQPPLLEIQGAVVRSRDA